MAPIFIVGDIHGHIEPLRRLLRDAGLIDGRDRWCGADASLWLIGDFFDRGPDGVGVVALAMRLQRPAAAAGGNVSALLGNHEVQILAARRFGRQPSLAGPNGTFIGNWEAYGGVRSDLERLGDAQAQWIARLPAMALVDEALLAHADATFYLDYGESIRAVNAAIRRVLHGQDHAAWDALLERFSQRRAFLDSNRESRAHLDGMFWWYGGRRLVHGHTPIARLAGQPPELVIAPLVYAQGRCVNVDHGLYLGGPGFVYRLPEDEP